MTAYITMTPETVISAPGSLTALTNQTDSGQNKLGPSDDRWKLRSYTYPGIAKAMAEQWGSVG